MVSHYAFLPSVIVTKLLPEKKCTQTSDRVLRKPNNEMSRVRLSTFELSPLLVPGDFVFLLLKVLRRPFERSIMVRHKGTGMGYGNSIYSLVPLPLMESEKLGRKKGVKRQ